MHTTTDLLVNEVTREREENGYSVISLGTPRGHIVTRFYEAHDPVAGMLWVGGIGGNFDTPADDLYPALSLKLKDHGISSLWLQYRNPNDLEEATYDALVGIEYLMELGLPSIGAGGWSFGGAVVVRAGVISRKLQTIVTIATQSYGADIVDRLPDNCSILLLHGASDETLSSRNSQVIYDIAHEPKQILILGGSRHGLSESRDEVHTSVFDWLLRELYK